MTLDLARCALAPPIVEDLTLAFAPRVQFSLGRKMPPVVAFPDRKHQRNEHKEVRENQKINHKSHRRPTRCFQAPGMGALHLWGLTKTFSFDEPSGAVG